MFSLKVKIKKNIENYNNNWYHCFAPLTDCTLKLELPNCLKLQQKWHLQWHAWNMRNMGRHFGKPLEHWQSLDSMDPPQSDCGPSWPDFSYKRKFLHSGLVSCIVTFLWSSLLKIKTLLLWDSGTTPIIPGCDMTNFLPPLFYFLRIDLSWVWIGCLDLFIN